jgi:invasion protein IalB
MSGGGEPASAQQATQKTPSTQSQGAASAAAPDAAAKAAHAARGEIFGAWQLLCSEAGVIDPAKRCRISQSVVSQSGEQRVLLVRVYKGEPATALVSTPHSIFLKPGLALQVDERRGRAYGFETCNEEGCHLGVQLDEAFRDEWEGGTKAMFHFYDGAAQKVVVPLSLDGFKAAMARLNEQKSSAK